MCCHPANSNNVICAASLNVRYTDARDYCTSVQMDAAIAKGLNDKIYDKRKAAALQLETSVHFTR